MKSLHNCGEYIRIDVLLMYSVCLSTICQQCLGSFLQNMTIVSHLLDAIASRSTDSATGDDEDLDRVMINFGVLNIGNYIMYKHKSMKLSFLNPPMTTLVPHIPVCVRVLHVLLSIQILI